MKSSLSLLILLVSWTMLLGCAPETKSDKSSPPPIADDNPGRDDGDLLLPKLPASNHPLGGWWVGTGSYYDTTGWVSQCKKIVLGIVANVPKKFGSDEVGQVSIERFDYDCDFGTSKWGRVAFDVSSTGVLRLEKSHVTVQEELGKAVGNVSENELLLRLSTEAMNYQLEFKFANDQLSFLDTRKIAVEERIVITDGQLTRVSSPE